MNIKELPINKIIDLYIKLENKIHDEEILNLSRDDEMSINERLFDGEIPEKKFVEWGLEANVKDEYGGYWMKKDRRIEDDSRFNGINPIEYFDRSLDYVIYYEYVPKREAKRSAK